MKDRLHDLSGWVQTALGHRPADTALFERAVTHASHGAPDYERLEFLGDRVLGLVVADWLYRLFPDEPEGMLSRRFNVLVSRETCADVARRIGVASVLRLGKQARDDGASDSDNVLGDIVEALIGALFLEGGLAPASAFVHRAWASQVDRGGTAPKHSKSALQEWAAANKTKPPTYVLLGRSGPQHASRFQVEVEIRGIGAARGEGSSKQEAETAAAQALLDRVE